MLCEHPACTSEAIRMCDHHCQLSLCRQHCLEHEQAFLNRFEEQLHQLRQPVSRLLAQSRSALKSAEESRQNELTRMNQIFDQYLSLINQRSQLSKIAGDFILNKREQIVKCRNGDEQLSREEHQTLQNLYKNLQENLQDQSQLTQLLLHKDRQIDPSSIVNLNSSANIECIELSDSEDDRSQHVMECDVGEQQEIADHRRSFSPRKATSPMIAKRKKKIFKWNSSNLAQYRDFCPMTKLGVFGLKSNHNLPRLCSEMNNKERCLYGHLIQTHRIKSSFACKIVKAIIAGDDPMTTIIFPDDDSFILKDNISCPLNTKTLKTLDIDVDVPHTPCYAILNELNLKQHLMNVHELSRENAGTISKAMKKVGNIDHIEWNID